MDAGALEAEADALLLPAQRRLLDRDIVDAVRPPLPWIELEDDC